MHKLKNSKLTLTVAIAAYNAEKNIKKLSESMLNQKEISFILNKVVINSDSSSDNTVKYAKSIKNKRMKVIDSKARTGFAGALVSLVKYNNTDVLCILNDDIIVNDLLFLEKLVRPFIKEKNIGLVCCNAQPLKSNNFVANAVRSGYIPYKQIGEEIKNGNNVYSVDGKTLCLSKKFIKTIRFPNDYRHMGNVDKHIYFACINNQFIYRYVKDAIIYFKCPSTIKDFTKWQIRNFQSTKYIHKSYWGGKLVDKEYILPVNKFRYYKLLELLKNPLGGLFIFTLGIYCSFQARFDKTDFKIKWDTVQTTKEID